MCRYAEVRKQAVTCGKRGVTTLGDWADETGPLLIVEGPSDTLALAQTGS
jgi:hypothetical protein